MSVVAASAASIPAPERAKQLRLFSVPNPLTTHLGDAFFRALPRSPGVYFFHDETGRLLYVGRSNNLRARIGSYRHVCYERHPRRTLRLVHQVRRIEWELCSSPLAAIARERELLLTLHPPFNRAGVWQGQPWWLHLERHDTALRLWLSRAEMPAVTASAILPDSDALSSTFIEARPNHPLVVHQSFGPYRGEFPFVYSSITRTALRYYRAGLKLSDFPAGWLDARRLAEAWLDAGPSASSMADLIEAFLLGKDDGLIPKIDITASEHEAPLSIEDQFLHQDVETLQEFFTRLNRS